MKKIFLHMTITLIALALLACTKQRQGTPEARVSLIAGSAEIEQQGTRRPLAVGELIHPGDLVITGAQSAVVLDLGKGFADIEIQEKAVYALDSLEGPSRGCTIQQGNIWVRVKERLTKGEEFVVKSRTTVASVRGTKFYTFTIGSIQGTCMCQGVADMNIPLHGFHREHRQDHIIVSRGGTTAILSPSELAAVMPLDDAHHHSSIDGSPLGKKNTLAPEKAQQLMRLFEDRLAAAGAKEREKPPSQ